MERVKLHFIIAALFLLLGCGGQYTPDNPGRIDLREPFQISGETGYKVYLHNDSKTDTYRFTIHIDEEGEELDVEFEELEPGEFTKIGNSIERSSMEQCKLAAREKAYQDSVAQARHDNPPCKECDEQIRLHEKRYNQMRENVVLVKINYTIAGYQKINK